MQISLNNATEKLASKFDRLTESLFHYTRGLLDTGKFDQEKEKIVTIFEKLSYKD